MCLTVEGMSLPAKGLRMRTEVQQLLRAEVLYTFSRLKDP